METYIRFQTRLRCGDTGRPAGIFLAAGRVEDRKTLPPVTREQLADVLAWFNHNLTVPGLASCHWRCLFWFRANSQVVIRRIWELAWLLEDEGIFVTKVRTRQPGMIIYRDEHQVAAIPQRDRERKNQLFCN